MNKNLREYVIRILQHIIYATETEKILQSKGMGEDCLKSFICTLGKYKDELQDILNGKLDDYM